MTNARAVTLLDALVAGRESAGLARAIQVGAVLFVASLTAAAAQFSAPLPFTQVPFTLQPMIVLLGGVALGPRLGSASQVLYLAAGVAGLPVFAASASLPPGALRLLGPTGGYLMAYPLAAFVAGWLVERRGSVGSQAARSYLESFVAMFCGLTIIYACGTAWLGLFARTASGSAAVGVSAALATGVLPFVAADVMKLALAAGVMPGVWRLLGRTAPR